MLKFILAAGICVGALVSCNTMKGIGEDVQSLGKGVTNASEKTSDAIDREANR